MDLYFKDFIVEMNNLFTENGWTKVSDDGMFCGLIRPIDTYGAMAHYDWDFHYEESLPNLELAASPNYVRFPGTQCEALAICRDGYENIEQYVELSEEFKLYFNLHDDYKGPDKHVFYAIAKDGNHEDVVMIDGMRMLVNTSYLKNYLATREMNLLIFFDFIRKGDVPFKDLAITPIINKVEKSSDWITVFSLFEGWESKAASRLEGKVLMSYNPKDFIDPYNRPRESHKDFIYGVDEKGNILESTCQKDSLPNRFTYTGSGPYVMTPIFFRKSVLDKYYGHPEIYTVEDGYVSCKDAWLLKTVDNDHRDYVVVPLGYLSDLPDSEQNYWKSYNIKPPYGGQLSVTADTRWNGGKACNPQIPDLLFKIEFVQFNERWQAKCGWPLFLPLTPADEHRWKTFHCLTTPNNAVDFDEQVLSLVKITIDSLNQEELKNHIDPVKQDVLDWLKGKNTELKDVKAGIDKFQLYCLSCDITCDDLVQFLRNLQSLRSFDVAHRKSSDPKKREKFLEYFDYYNKTHQQVLEWITEKWISCLKALIEQL